MNVATILKLKGSGVFTTTKDKSLLDIAKLLAQHGIGCIVIVGRRRQDRGHRVGARSHAGHRPSGPQSLERASLGLHDQDCGHGARGRHESTELMSEMTRHRFRHMPVVERGRLLGLVSIGDLVKIRVADAEFESGAMRQYISPQPSLLFDQASRLSLAGGA